MTKLTHKTKGELFLALFLNFQLFQFQMLLHIKFQPHFNWMKHKHIGKFSNINWNIFNSSHHNRCLLNVCLELFTSIFFTIVTINKILSQLECECQTWISVKFEKTNLSIKCLNRLNILHGESFIRNLITKPRL